jgi:single-strand DNA-binding protein
MRTTSTGKNVCTFRGAVNSRKQGQEATFFKTTAWDKTAESCMKYLDKGRKVAVSGPVSLETYEGRDGHTRASLCITAHDVEFLSPKNEDGSAMGNMGQGVEARDASGFQKVDDPDSQLPF